LAYYKKVLNNVIIKIWTDVFGLLEPNGAAKSRLMRTIATLHEGVSGIIESDGVNLMNARITLRN
jgi:ABC-type multidrug transport system ATPase subunit